VFDAAGAFVARVPGGAGVLLAALLGLDAVVAALLNLDTAVVFLTPVLLHAARRRGIAEEPFLYGSVFVANSASLLLPGSNLTNLIVLARQPAPGSAFAARMAPAWALAVAITIVVVGLACRGGPAPAASADDPVTRARLGPGGAGIAAAAVLVLVLAQPALPVLGLGLAVALASRLRLREVVAAANPALLLGVLGLAVALGTAGQALGSRGSLLAAAGRWQTAWLAAGASLVVDNLPAAVVLAAPLAAHHPHALLLGLDLGPNLAVSGSLSALLWLRIGRAHGARPSALRYTLLGLVLVPLTLTGSLLVTGA